MEDVFPRLDAIARDLRQASRLTAESKSEAVSLQFQSILNLIQDERVRYQAEGAHLLCSIYLHDLAERSAPSGLGVALSSVERLRTALKGVR